MLVRNPKMVSSIPCLKDFILPMSVVISVSVCLATSNSLPAMTRSAALTASDSLSLIAPIPSTSPTALNTLSTALDICSAVVIAPSANCLIKSSAALLADVTPNEDNPSTVTDTASTVERIASLKLA